MRTVPAPVIAAALAAFLASPLTSFAGEAGSAVSIPGALDRGTNWLLSKQNPDGGYGPAIGSTAAGSNLGISAFALYALARSPRGYKEVDGPFISKAVKFLLDRQQPSGAFFDPKDPSIQNYKTSVAVLALAAVDRVKHAGAIAKAAKFIIDGQISEATGSAKDKDVNFGGIGYGGPGPGGKPDLSNTQFAADALHEAGVSGADDVWVRLQVFLSRCQNGKALDPLVKAAGVGTTKDGGFRYQPAGTRGGQETVDGDRVFSSYGSITYAGLKSMLHAQMKKDDPRVQAAFDWIRANFTVETNPGMAAGGERGQGLFYYYHTMAKTLSIYGEPVIVDDKGGRHVWAKELGEKIASLQGSEGSWKNTAERWMEGIDVLDTSYAIVALAICKEELDRIAKERPELLR